MGDQFEIENHGDHILVFMRNWKGGYGLAAEFHEDSTLKDVEQEIYDLLACAGHTVKIREP